jgi:hypothetical protein
MNFQVVCRNCKSAKAIRHRADLCAECLDTVDPALVDAYIDASLALNSGRFVLGDYERASKALREALEHGR